MVIPRESQKCILYIQNFYQKHNQILKPEVLRDKINKYLHFNPLAYYVLSLIHEVFLIRENSSSVLNILYIYYNFFNLVYFNILNEYFY